MKKPKKSKPQPPAPVRESAPGGGGEWPAGETAPAPRTKVGRVVVGDIGGEPVARRGEVPALLLMLLAALIYFGDMFVVENGGQLDARVHHPFRTVKDLDDLQPKGEDDLLRAKGQKIYKMYCAACHQDDGNGSPSQNVPPLAASDWVTPKDPSRIIRVVLNGLTGPIVVNGKPWGVAAMVPWRDSLTDDDVAAVLTYVRTSWGNKAPAVKADAVKKIRDATKDKNGNWTGDELMQIPLAN
jgi:mono/diheme cytochrome c family protein